MAEPPPYPHGADPAAGPEGEAARSRWVTVLGMVIVAIVIIVIVYLHLTGVIGPGAHG